MPNRHPRDRKLWLFTFGSDSRGVAAIEFSLVLPLLVTMCFGLAEICNALENYRKLTLYTRAVADLSGRASVVSIDTIFGAAGAILQPYDTSSIQIRVSAIGVQQKSLFGVIATGFEGQVCSSVASNTTSRPVKQKTGSNGIPEIPEAFKYDKAHYIFTEATMSYKPIIGSEIAKLLFGPAGLTFSQQIAWADRTDTEVVFPGGSKCS